MVNKGYIQIYTGNGKGKTTAALGLALRAVGNGYKVFIGQFMKGQHYSELNSLKRFEGEIEIMQLGGECFVFGKPSDEDICMANNALKICADKMLSQKYDVVIMDEINVAVHLGLIDEVKVLEMMSSKPDGVELIMTGRGATARIIREADLVTEMKEIKHYYEKQVDAREGIEN